MTSTDHARIGVVDVGSNSVRLVVFDGPLQSPSYFFNEKVLCGLGTGLSETGRLYPEGRERALSAIGRFAAISKAMHLDKLIGVATAAVRRATDGLEFVREVEARTGLVLTVASGREEARLSAQGVLLGWPDADGLVVDIGGASMELARVHGGEIIDRVTSNLGPLALSDDPQLRSKEIAKGLAALRESLPDPIERMFLVGGSWRAMAQIDMNRRGYPLPVLHAYQMTPEALAETAGWLTAQTPEALQEVSSSSSARLSLVPRAAEVMVGLLDSFSPSSLAVSAFGLREGVLYDLIPQEARGQDPLITAARHLERTAARFPGLGDVLFNWLAPLIEAETPARQRLIHAACLLHDIHWRAHPDTRRRFAFEAATRANLGGVDHAGRVFIALALSYRYKSGSADDPVMALLPDAEAVVAEQAGRAIRLGAMLTGGCAATLAKTRLRLTEETLDLHIVGEARAYFGEVAAKRLARLARSLERDFRIIGI